MPVENSWDLIVVGGGISGMTAAVRAAERGLRTVVLEKGEDELYLCNSRYTGGAFHVAFHDIAEDADSLAQVITDVTRGYAKPALARAVAAETRQAVAWLRTQGVRFIKAGPDGWLQNFLAPPALQQPGLNWRGRGGDVMLRTLRARLEAKGGALLGGWRARDLIMEAGRCAGVVAERGGVERRFTAGATVLCDGGFQANLELLREYVCPAPEKLKQRGAATGVGDALQMARKAGAKLVGMENIYGHLLCQDALRDDKLWPYPILDLIAGAGIVVDATCKRFTDEGLGGVYMTNCIARLADPLSACVVFDRAIWDGPATEFILPANPHLVATGGTIVAGDTLEALAGKLSLDAASLARTVAEYNAAVDAGAATALTPPRTTSEKTKPYPIRQAPFYAVRIAAGITYTMGGMATDEHARVLDAADAPIPNLYAAGCATGGLDGGQAAGYVSGLAKSAVMGLRAAEHIADRHTPGAGPGATGTGGGR